ncbi:MAG TPA: ankyrin repeat domain-containing protein [Acetobacteraceae bacterium]
MPTVLYRMPFGDRLSPGRLPVELTQELQDLRADTKSANIDDASKVCEVFVDFKDLRTRYPRIARIIGGSGTAGQVAEDFGTPELQGQRKKSLDDARDSFRTMVYPATDPSTTTPIIPAMDQATGIAAMTANPGDGFCLGTGHDDQESKAMLCNAVDSGALTNGLLFMEEIPTILQPVVEAWLQDGDNASALPVSLKLVLSTLDEAIARRAGGPVALNFTALLRKAKEKSVRVVGIDGGDADAGVDGEHAGFAERRVAKMNRLAADVIQHERAAKPNAKFIASVGQAHMNTHDGGIPGIGQLCNIPSITVDPPSGKLVPRPDDTTKRAMPSAEEQAFIDRYIDSIEAGLQELIKRRLGDVRATLSKDIYDNARALAAQLRADGKLPNIGSVDAALNEPVTKQRRAAYIEVINGAPNQVEETDLDKFVTTALGAGSKALATLTTRHIAARGRVDLLDKVVTAGADVNARDEKDDQPIHAAVRIRRERNDPRAKDQALTVESLIASGADANATGDGGRTAMHHAALNNNTQALDSLQTRGGRTDIADKRGWTPYDVSVGSTKVEAEEWFYAHGQANPPGVNAGSASLSSVDALMKAVKCENPKHVAKIQAALTELHGNPDLRPVLDLLALDSLQPRDPRGGGGLRIYVADSNEVSGLYNNPEKRMNAGYDDGAHVALVAAQSSGDFAGELIHELTHAAARVACGNNTQPFKPGAKDDYRQAAMDDVRATTLLWPDNPKESAVKDRISGRMDSYVLRYPAEAEEKLMQEFIVGVPQLMAEYGSAEVSKLAPNLSQYFRTDFATDCNTAANGAKYSNARSKIDNTNLIATAQPRTPAPATRIMTQADTPTRMTGMIRANYKAVHGGPTGDTATTPYAPDQLGMVNHEEWAFDARMQRVEKLLLKLLAEQGLPAELAVDGLRDLATDMGKQIEAAASVKDIDAPAIALATNWVRKAKVDYAIQRRSDGVLPDDRALAEAIVIRAEDKVWNTPPVTSTGPIAVEVDPKKHQTMIERLTAALGTASNKDRANPAQLLDRLATALAGDKSSGFYRKVDRTGTAAPHVSISGKNAKRVWMEELKAA